MNPKTTLTKEEFHQIKQKTDDEVVRLGWTKRFCKRYIQLRYKWSSRLHMPDHQLIDLLASLREIPTPTFSQSLLKRRKKRKANNRI